MSLFLANVLSFSGGSMVRPEPQSPVGAVGIKSWMILAFTYGAWSFDFRVGTCGSSNSWFPSTKLEPKRSSGGTCALEPYRSGFPLAWFTFWSVKFRAFSSCPLFFIIRVRTTFSWFWPTPSSSTFCLGSCWLEVLA